MSSGFFHFIAFQKYSKSLTWVPEEVPVSREKRGKEIYDDKIKIWVDDYDLIYKLLIYFLHDKEEATRLGMNLNKGMLLNGPIGCGKTSLMNLMRFVPTAERNHIMKACRK